MNMVNFFIIKLFFKLVGFKLKGTNKTLAILVEGQTLIFSFYYADSMLFWKEWLKDVCGRSRFV